VCAAYFYSFVRFEVLTAVRMAMSFFWVTTSCRVAGREKHVVCSPEDGDGVFLRNVDIYL
jgi:hypothetical protein